MKSHEFISKLEHDEIVAAIRDAEQKTSGEIRVYISHRNVTDALSRAKKRFDKLGMHRTKHSNAVLIYLAPRGHVFAIIGDKGVHEKCGETFWNEVSAQLSHDLKNGTPTDAIIRAVRKVGELLAAHFPADGEVHGELPDKIEGD